MAQLANLTTTLAIESASFVNGIEQSRGAVRRLVASLDPAAAAQAKFNRQMDLAERGLKSGQLSADLYERVVGRLRSQLDAATGSGGRLVETSGSMRAGFQQLGYQLGDISQGFAMGTSAATIFAQQSGQVIQALQLMTTETQGVMTLLSGPWGAVLSAALVAVTPFVAKIFEGNDGLADQVQKLQDNAAKQQIAAAANRIFAGTQAGLDQRIRETTNAINQQNASLRTNAELQNINAKAEYAAAQKKLADAQATEQAANKRVAQLSTPGATDPRLAGAKQDASDSLAAAQDAARQARDSVQQATQAVINSRVALAAEQAAADAAANTRAGKITKQYDDQIKAIRLKAAAAAQSGKDMAVAEYQQIKHLEIEKQTALDAIQTEKTARTKAIHEGQTEARAAQRLAIADAKATASMIADASAGAYKAIAGLQKDQHKELTDLFKADAKSWDDLSKTASTAFSAAQDQRLADEHDLQQTRLDNIRDVAGFYRDLFEGGTKRIWQDFESMGFDIISKLLAKWTMNAVMPSSGSGGIFGAIGNALGLNLGQNNAAINSWMNGGSGAGLGFGGGAQVNLPGFANGGSFEFGGMSGIDKNVLSLNGSPIAKVSKGETAMIGRGAANDRGSIVFDLRGAVMTEDLLRQMNAMADGAAIRGAAGGAALAQSQGARRARRALA